MPQPPRRRPVEDPQPAPGKRRPSAKVVPRSTPLVSLRFREGVNVPRAGQGAADAFMEEGFRDEWNRVRTMFPGAKLVPAFERVPLQQLEALGKRAREKRQDYKPPRFRSMFRLELPPKEQWAPGAPRGPKLAQQLEQLLNDTLPVDRVNVEALLAPLPMRDLPGGSADLRHLDPAGQGLGVEAPWQVPAGQGGNVIFADVERGWVTTSAEFAGKTFVMLPGGVNFPADQEHGTMVLGLIMALKEGAGIMGVAPQAANAVLSSEVRGVDAAGRPLVNTADAILDAILELVKPGASPCPVLLIESQVSMHDYDGTFPEQILGPSELNPDVYDLIEIAGMLDIVVVEAAGNGGVENAGLETGVDLDSLAVAKLLHGDSGAILVGQAMFVDGTGHTEIPFGCKGARIDCFSWGDRVITLSSSPVVPLVYFGGTSSASALIAGAAVLLQGFAASSAATGHKPLAPAALRAVFRDRAINTPLADGSVDVVGVQPDLKAICLQLGLLPLV